MVERVDEVVTEKIVGAIDLVEFSDLEIVIDSVEVERIESESPVTKIRSGQVTVKLKREATSRAVAVEERETELSREYTVAEVGEMKTDVKRGTTSGWWFLIVAVVGVACLYRIVKK